MARAGGAVDRYARAVVALRHVIILGWLALAVGASFLPSLSASGSDVEGFVGPDNPAIATEIASARAFGFPLSSRVVLVQHDPDGLSVFTQAEAVLRAIALTQGGYDQRVILGALPVLNTLGLFPSSAAQGTTALTYFFVRPGTGFGTRSEAAIGFARRNLEPEDSYVGVTGSVPARAAQARIVEESLPHFEIATLAAIVLVVGLSFRALAPPVLALAASGVGFVVATHLNALGGALLGITVPAELEPLILALLLGVTTDYAIFFLSGMRDQLGAGRSRLDAARSATTEFGPIVGVAGLTVAAGTASLLVAESAFFRAFGPAMALAVLVSLMVSVTLVPAMMALLGRWAFWPAGIKHAPRTTGDDATGNPAVGGDGPVAEGRHRASTTGLTVRRITRRPVALLVVLASTAVLLLAAVPLRDLRLGVGFIQALPPTSQVSAATAAAADGFAPGIVAPSELLLQGPRVAKQRDALSELVDRLRGRPGVAGVLGPGDLVEPVESRVLLATSGDAARILVILDDLPLGAEAIATLRDLQEALPGLLDEVGLEGVQWGFAGDTALSAALVESTQDDLVRIAVAALLINLLLLVVFLRALVAPLYLLATSVLALCAALGATTFVFQDLLGYDGLTFYVPFSAAVLLIALGSDYNIFSVGHIWTLARTQPLRTAIIEAVPRTTRALTTAGITLAVSFGMLALVPLRPFRELAFVMAVGILLDSIVVRSLLMPALLSLVGPVSGWPGRTLAAGTRRQPEPSTGRTDAGHQ